MRTLPASAVVAESLLVVLPAPADPACPGPATIIAGLPMIRRVALAAERAGFERILIHPRVCPDPRLLEGTAAVLLGAETVPAPMARLVLLPANVLPQARWLRALRDMPLEPETLSVDITLAAAVETTTGGDLLHAAGQADDLVELIAQLSRKLARVEHADDSAGRFRLAGEAGAAAAEAWLLRSLIKDTEGFMSRHLERRVSLSLTRRLVTTSITPNAMTLVSLAVGLLGAPFFLSSDPWLQVAGGLLFLTHSILDGCDGELARLKFLESPRGARLDFWGDNLVHVAVFASMAVGWSQSVDAVWPLLLGALAVSGTAAAAILVARQSAEAANASAGPLADAVANRDFIYLVILLACFGRAHWFLVLVALGTPVFMLLVRWGTGRHRAA